MNWQVESTGPHTTLVVRRHKGIQQDLHRNESGRIVWFESKEAAQQVADELNGVPEQAKQEAKES